MDQWELRVWYLERVARVGARVRVRVRGSISNLVDSPMLSDTCLSLLYRSSKARTEARLTRWSSRLYEGGSGWKVWRDI